ncbi:MAG: hypothetical protein IKN56_01110 [Clostridia bacterium]|nr:hypothetical protein [Clostridia bacterium]
MKDIFDIIDEWEDLIDEAKYHGAVDDDLFRECMNDAYHCFFPENKRKEQLEKEEIQLYGMIAAYSKLPVIAIDDENILLFEASMLVAADFESFILRPGAIRLNGSKMEYVVSVVNSVENKEVYNQHIAYDFETGDLSDYIELYESGYYDYR